MYLTLLSQGTRRVGQIASATGIVRPEVYRILRELASKGLVQRILGPPSTYRAVPVSQGLSLVLDRYRRRLTTLEQKKISLVKSIESYSSNIQERSDGEFRIIPGARTVLSKIRQIISGTRIDYVSIMSKYGLGMIKKDGIMPALVSAAGRNVRVRVISEIDESNIPIADQLSQYVELRQGSQILFYIDIFDKKEMFLGPAISDKELDNPSERSLDLWTNSLAFINGMYAFFDYLWRKSQGYTHEKNRGRP